MADKPDGQKEASVPAVVYVSRLPYGFDDEAGRTFFKQFGDIKGVCFPRSVKSGRSKGYMFVLFADQDVAKVAASAIDGYYAFGKTISAKVLDRSQKILFTKFKEDRKKFRFTPWQKMFQKSFNSTTDQEKLHAKYKKLIQADRNKQDAFQRKGIDFPFPTYEAQASLPE